MKTTQDTIENVTDAVRKQREKWRRDNEIAEQKLEMFAEMQSALAGLLAIETRYTNVGLSEFDAARSILARADKIGGGK